MLVLKENTLPSFEWGIVVAIYLDDGYLNNKLIKKPGVENLSLGNHTCGEKVAAKIK